MKGMDKMDWQEIAKWLWAMLLLPFAWLWKRADNAVTKEDFRRHEEEDHNYYRDFSQQLKDTATAASEDRQMLRESIDRLVHEMHAMHVTLLGRIENTSSIAAAAAASAAAAATLVATKKG